MAAGKEPRPPAWQTAIASSGPCALAIGAWTRGTLEGRKVINTRSCRQRRPDKIRAVRAKNHALRGIEPQRGAETAVTATKVPRLLLQSLRRTRCWAGGRPRRPAVGLPRLQFSIAARVSVLRH